MKRHEFNVNDIVAFHIAFDGKIKRILGRIAKITPDMIIIVRKDGLTHYRNPKGLFLASTEESFLYKLDE